MYKKIFYSILSILIFSLLIAIICNEKLIDIRVFLVIFSFCLFLISFFWLIPYAISKSKIKWRNYVGYGIPVLFSSIYLISILKNLKYSDCGNFLGCGFIFGFFLIFIPSLIYTVIYSIFTGFSKKDFIKIIPILAILILVLYILPSIFNNFYHLMNRSLPSGFYIGNKIF